MLEAMRQNSRSAIIYILFVILIVAFIFTFGPGSPGGSSNGSTGGAYAAKVGGDEISESEFRYIYQVVLGAEGSSAKAREARVKEYIMDRLIDRELLAQQAERDGLAASEKEVTDMLTSGKMIILGRLAPVNPYAFKGGIFDYERFRAVAQSYQITVKNLIELERREVLADKLRQIMQVATKVSPDEVKADFEANGRQVNLEYVRFSPRRYAEDLNPGDAEVEDWAKAHEADIKKVYDERKFMYQKQEPSVHLRRILIELPKDAAADKVKEAQDKLDAAQKTLASGTRFGDVARTVSEDALSKGRGGDLRWLRKGATGLGEEVEKTVFAAKAGDVIGPIRTDRGLELIKVEGQRQGDISLAAARTELAEELLREARSKELAKAAATDTAGKVKAGGKLAELFPKGDSDSEEARPRAGKAAKLTEEETGLFARRGDVIQGMGPSAELARAAFTTMKPGDTLGPLEIGDGFVVVTLKEKKEPDMADWDKRKQEILSEYQRTKWAEVVSSWTKQKCTQVKDAGKINVNPEILTYEGGPAKDLFGLAERKYEPCSGRMF